MKILTYNFLKDSDKVYVDVGPEFTDFIKGRIIQKYKSLKGYNHKILRINYQTFKWAFRKKRYHKLKRLLRIAESFNIPEEKVFEIVKGFYCWGSRRKNCLILPKEIPLNDFFVEGYALYLAEGDTGFNGRKKPRKLRFTNSELNVIKHYIKWLGTFFTACSYYVNVILPRDTKLPIKDKENILKELDLNKNRVKFCKGDYNKQIKYRVCLDQAIVIDLILAIEESVKERVGIDEKLAASYIKGMMIGEGTAYCNRSKYVRIEMKNKKEINFIGGLLDFLGIGFNKSCRFNREGMWSLYIGGKDNIKRYAELIGFGVHKKRQNILNKILERG